MFDAPLTFEPVLVDKPWGGDRLARFGRGVAAGARIGESWDLTDLGDHQTPVPDAVSRVVGGTADGVTLRELDERDRPSLLGASSPSHADRFPLLVKLLDAREALSVQVHPPASLSPDEHKTESWVVLAADEGATLLLGVEAGVRLDQVTAAMGTADLLPLVAEVAVQAGDVVHLPAGMIHALGAGVLVAEVQTTSDTTYRVWDWPEDRDGGRELHVERARAAVAAGWEHNLDVRVDRARTGVLVDDDSYRLSQESLRSTEPLVAAGEAGSARVLIVTAGSLRWAGDDGDDHHLDTGGVALLPAVCDRPVLAGPGGATVVVATPA